MKQVLRVEDSLIVSFKPNVTRFDVAMAEDDESFTFRSSGVHSGQVVSCVLLGTENRERGGLKILLKEKLLLPMNP